MIPSAELLCLREMETVPALPSGTISWCKISAALSLAVLSFGFLIEASFQELREAGIGTKAASEPPAPMPEAVCETDAYTLLDVPWPQNTHVVAKPRNRETATLQYSVPAAG